MQPNRHSFYDLISRNHPPPYNDITPDKKDDRDQRHNRPFPSYNYLELELSLELSLELESDSSGASVL